ncbi:MAG: hypothetical protein AB7F19_01770 [Candidatus Babeliales bacterium]
MNTLKYYVWCMLFFYCTASQTLQINLTPAQKKEIAERIWFNEASGHYDKLVFWNQNENFPSLGICHFIWFPENCKEQYTQTFPELLQYFKKNLVHMPAWLQNAHYAPWSTRAEFLKPEHQQQIEELKALMYSTMHVQVDFIIDRFERMWPDIQKQALASEQQKITANYTLLMQSPQGIFALLDYLNFKGAGIDPKERYNNVAWGLLQVLQTMETTHKEDAVAQFVQAAKAVLTNRVSHAPVDKAHEKQWLPGFFNRLDRYQTALS